MELAGQYKVIATQWWTAMALQKFVFHLAIGGNSAAHRYSNKSFDILKFSTQSLSLQPWQVSSQKDWDMLLLQTQGKLGVHWNSCYANNNKNTDDTRQLQQRCWWSHLLASFAQFFAIFRQSSLRVFQYKSTIFCPSTILFTFNMLWLYDVVTFYVNYNYTNVRLSTNMRLHCCQLLLFSVNGLIS